MSLCDACETVAHCNQHGCIPLQPDPAPPRCAAQPGPSPFASMVQTLERHAQRNRKELQDAEVVELRRQKAAGGTQRGLAKVFGISPAAVWSICSRRTRKEVIS